MRTTSKTLKKVMNSVIKTEFGISDRKILNFIYLSFFKNRKHSHYIGYKSYSYTELAKVFGRNNFTTVNNLYGLFELLPHSKDDGYTRGIRQSTKLVECFNRVIDAWLPAIDETLASESDCSKSGGIASRDTNGNNTKFKSDVLQAVQVNIKALANLTKISPKNDREYRIKAQAAVMLDLALDKKHLPKNWISQRYIQHKTGRLYSEGVSLQNCCREVRYSALTGLHSYDVDNCHYSILAQTTKSLTPSIDHYLNNKKSVRNNLSRELDLPIDDVKQILISLIFGARLSAYRSGNAIADICNDAKTYNKVLSNKLVQGLYDDVTRAGKELIDNNTLKVGKFTGKVQNAMGLICDERVSNKQLSHVLQGYEVKALEIVTSITRTDTAALLHDGWVTYTKHDNKVFEEAILSKLGLKLKVDHEIVECKYYQYSKSPAATDNSGTQGISKKIACKLIESRLFPTCFNVYFHYKSKSISSISSQPTTTGCYSYLPMPNVLLTSQIVINFRLKFLSSSTDCRLTNFKFFNARSELA